MIVNKKILSEKKEPAYQDPNGSPKNLETPMLNTSLF